MILAAPAPQENACLPNHGAWMSQFEFLFDCDTGIERGIPRPQERVRNDGV
jgi:hypothetical protein